MRDNDQLEVGVIFALVNDAARYYRAARTR